MRTIQERVLTIVKDKVAELDELEQNPSLEIEPTKPFEEYRLNRLDYVEIKVAIEKEFGITIPPKIAKTFTNAQDYINYIYSND